MDLIWLTDTVANGPATWTITEARDYPMLLANVKIIAWIVVILLSGIGSLIAVLITLVAWLGKSARDTFLGYVKEQSSQCGSCKKEILGYVDRGDDALWTAVDHCCPREVRPRVKELKPQRRDA